MNCKQRLLFFTAEPWPTFRPDVAVLFGKELPLKGVCTDLVALAATTPDTAPWGGGAVHLCAAEGGKARKIVAVWWHRLRFLLSMKPDAYQAIQVRDLPIFAALAGFVARRKGIPFYYWMSYPIPEGYIAQALERGLSAGIFNWAYNLLIGHLGRWVLYGHVLRRADHVFVQSDRMQEDLATIGVDRSRMTPVPMGVDWPAISRVVDLPPPDDARMHGRRMLVYLGTLGRRRHIEVLFQMLALVRRQVPEALLVLVGDAGNTRHRTWLQDQATAAGVAEHVIWTGWLPMEDGWRYVRAAEVGLSPFPRSYLLDSASPTKVPEYLALGTPVVCNDNPDQANVIAKSGSGICVPYTAENFAVAVLKVLTMPQAKLQDWMSAGRLYVATDRTYQKLATELASSYEHLLGTTCGNGQRSTERSPQI